MVKSRDNRRTTEGAECPFDDLGSVSCGTQDEEYGRTTVHIPNGVEGPTPEECSSTEVLQEFRLKPQEYVFFLGRLVPEKRVQDLITAYREIPGTRRLVRTGEGGFTDSYVGTLKRLA